jgi:hypothetical protein
LTDGDAGTVGVAESVTVYNQISSSDSSSVSITETAATLVGTGSGDSSSISVAESASIVVSGLVALSASDTGSLGVSENVTGTAVGFTGADSATLNTTETSSGYATTQSADTASLAVSENHVIDATQIEDIEKVGDDSASIQSIETALVSFIYPDVMPRIESSTSETGNLEPNGTSDILVNSTTVPEANVDSDVRPSGAVGHSNIRKGGVNTS